MQAQACFNHQPDLQPFPPLAFLPAGGIGGAGFSGAGGGGGASSSVAGSAAGAAAAAAGAAAGGAGAGAASTLAPSAGASSDKGAAWLPARRPHGTSPSAGSQEDLLIEIGERLGVAELCPKFVRGHGIECLENGCLVLKCAGMWGVLMKDGDGVYDEGEDVDNGLGASWW